MENENDNRYSSRKWKLVLLVIILATIGSFIPPTVSWFLGSIDPLIIISGTEWVSVVSMLIAAYITGNIWQKHVENKTSENKTITEIINKKEDGEA